MVQPTLFAARPRARPRCGRLRPACALARLSPIVSLLALPAPPPRAARPRAAPLWRAIWRAGRPQTAVTAAPAAPPSGDPT